MGLAGQLILTRLPVGCMFKKLYFVSLAGSDSRLTCPIYNIRFTYA